MVDVMLSHVTKCYRVVFARQRAAVFHTEDRGTQGVAIFADVITDDMDAVEEIRFYGIEADEMSVGKSIIQLGTYSRLEDVPANYQAVGDAF